MAYKDKQFRLSMVWEFVKTSVLYYIDYPHPPPTLHLPSKYAIGCREGRRTPKGNTKLNYVFNNVLLPDIHSLGIRTIKLVLMVFFLIEQIHITAYNIHVYFSKFDSFYVGRQQEVSFTRSVAEAETT